MTLLQASTQWQMCTLAHVLLCIHACVSGKACILQELLTSPALGGLPPQRRSARARGAIQRRRHCCRRRCELVWRRWARRPRMPRKCWYELCGSWVHSGRVRRPGVISLVCAPLGDTSGVVMQRTNVVVRIVVVHDQVSAVAGLASVFSSGATTPRQTIASSPCMTASRVSERRVQFTSAFPIACRFQIECRLHACRFLPGMRPAVCPQPLGLIKMLLKIR